MSLHTLTGISVKECSVKDCVCDTAQMGQALSGNLPISWLSLTTACLILRKESRTMRTRKIFLAACCIFIVGTQTLFYRREC